MSFIGSMFLVSVLVLALPAGLLLAVSSRIQRHELADRAARRLLVSLLAMINILIAAMYTISY